ncbi:putative carbonic anhydrase [Sterolibacterium denitrificans]|uniref:carbonic anhydrase n=1 Tax=Sterolibacterium denitrificans TaxID=157592 RepID=A0A7Z7MUA8_9PROT|nr:carbonic anhydrase family protein [Sterolibacterium denitrificans]SMB22324.1 putative carbonic anhydrase [Sterolibacterium denitrificans]
MRVQTLAILLALSSLSSSPLPGFFVSSAHAAAKWQTVASQEGKRIEIDKARIARVGAGQTIAWSRLVLDRELAVDEQRYNRVEVLNRYDCAGQHFATVKRVYLQGGTPVKEEVIGSGAQRQISVQAGSIDAKLLGEACKLRTVGEMQAVAEIAREAAGAASPAEEQTVAKVMLADVRQLAATPEEAREKAARTQTVAEQRIELPSKAELAAKAAADKALLTDMAASELPPQSAAPANAAASAAPVAPVVSPIPSAASLRRPVPRRVVARSTTPAPTASAPVEAAPVARPVIPWSYEGEGAPANWGKLRSDYVTCGSGKRQSPIDIRDSINVDLEQIRFDYKPTLFRIIDTGHTVEVHVGEGSTLTVMGRQYELVQLHFHRPSEERINGKVYDMSVHLVHRSLEGQLAYLAVLLEKGSEHPLIQTLWNNLPLEVGQELVPEVSIDLNGLLPENRTYWTYMGSLTTPPCTENVLWLVLKQPLQVSPEQIAIFSRLYRNNVRPLQPANNRLIKGSR